MDAFGSQWWPPVEGLSGPAQAIKLPAFRASGPQPAAASQREIA